MRYLALRENAVSCAVGEEMALLRFSDNHYLSLNEYGALIWDFLQEPRTLDEVVEKIADSADIAAQDCRDDVAEFIESMISEKLVSRLSQ